MEARRWLGYTIFRCSMKCVDAAWKASNSRPTLARCLSPCPESSAHTSLINSQRMHARALMASRRRDISPHIPTGSFSSLHLA